MSAEYNSKLISKLYKTVDKEEIIEILSEMDEINDTHFLYPIYDKYKECKGDTFSHYFVSSLGKIKGEESTQVIIEIAENDDTDDLDFIYTLSILGDLGLFGEKIVRRVIGLVSDDEYVKDNDYNFSSLLSYLKKAGVLKAQDIVLLHYIFEEDFSVELKKVSLAYLLRLDPNEYLKYFYDNYERLKNTKAEVIFAKEVAGWSKGIAEDVKRKILEQGSARAKEIITLSNKTKDAVEEKKEKDAINKYSNVTTVTQIYDLRSKINLKASAKFGHDLFSPSESLYKQNKEISTKAELVDSCIGLRDFIQKISDNCNCNTDLEEARKILGSSLIEADLDKSINRLGLYLSKFGISIDGNIFGLKKIYQSLNKIGAHPTDNKEVAKQLNFLGALKDYTDENWPSVHRKILTMYLEALAKLNDAIVI